MGIAGGNGLEHINSNDFNLIYGIDINQKYLQKVRYNHLKCLRLKKLDLNDLDIDLPIVDLIIANLIIEYIGINNFTSQISKSSPNYLSCIIQENNNNNFVSNSKYFEDINESSINSELLSNELNKINFELILKKEYELPNNKRFIRFDYENL